MSHIQILNIDLKQNSIEREIQFFKMQISTYLLFLNNEIKNKKLKTNFFCKYYSFFCSIYFQQNNLNKQNNFKLRKQIKLEIKKITFVKRIQKQKIPKNIIYKIKFINNS